jgi:hypothetical protein
MPLLQAAIEFTASRKLLLYQAAGAVALGEAHLDAGRVTDALDQRWSWPVIITSAATRRPCPSPARRDRRRPIPRPGEGDGVLPIFLLTSKSLT